MIISKINTEIETFCIDSDFRQSYPPNRFFGKGVRFGYSTVSFRAPFLSFKQD